MGKEIRWSEHATLKLTILKQRSLEITPEQVIETIRSPDATFTENEKMGKRSRYEKDSL